MMNEGRIVDGKAWQARGQRDQAGSGLVMLSLWLYSLYLYHITSDSIRNVESGTMIGEDRNLPRAVRCASSQAMLLKPCDDRISQSSRWARPKYRGMQQGCSYGMWIQSLPVTTAIMVLSQRAKYHVLVTSVK